MTLQFSVLLFVILLCGPAWAQNGDPNAEPVEKSVALLIIDVQNCFVSGTLAVPKGPEVIPVINKIRRNYGGSYKATFITQDWHCPNHVSFASQHLGHAINTNISLSYTESGDLCTQSTTGQTVSVPYAKDCSAVDAASKRTISQTLWPDHCVRETNDAKLDSKLIVEKNDVIIKKGSQCQVDSYSAFYDNGKITETDLFKKLDELGIFDVHIVGLAADYCVYYTAKDAYGLSFETVVIQDATRGISADTTQAAFNDMRSKGIKVINSDDLHTLIPLAPTSAASLMTSHALVAALSVVFVAMFI